VRFPFLWELGTSLARDAFIFWKRTTLFRAVVANVVTKYDGFRMKNAFSCWKTVAERNARMEFVALKIMDALNRNQMVASFQRWRQMTFSIVR
jgi:hypothetical protein